MELTLKSPDSFLYSSGSQKARVLTEAWAARNLYCPSCISNSLCPTPVNTAAVDFTCLVCAENYQLKSGQRMPSRRIVDSAYGAMIAAIRSDTSPNLLYLHYSEDWKIQNLLLIPRFFFREHCIEPRKPLSPTARRAGWVGCNIRVDLIPPEGRIEVISSGVETGSENVRSKFSQLRPLLDTTPSLRGWTLAVLSEVHKLNRLEFSLEDLYALEGSLREQYPGNSNIRAKIRQQLQVLRDLGILSFLGGGRYEMHADSPR